MFMFMFMVHTLHVSRMLCPTLSCLYRVSQLQAASCKKILYIYKLYRTPTTNLACACMLHVACWLLAAVIISIIGPKQEAS